MKKNEVPQDHGINGPWRPICYAVDEASGEYTPTQSSGWEPANVANGIAWEFIQEDLDRIIKKIRDGELSTLAYHMTKNLMDVKTLAKYVNLSSWKVKRHLKPRVFRGLDEAVLERYASVFKINTEEVKTLP
jgi:hypothetical protein